MWENNRANALLEGTTIRKVPESLLEVPPFFPNMEMETLLRGRSFSSTIFPVTTAGLFCPCVTAAKKNKIPVSNKRGRTVIKYSF
jgi:hypothetical protein